MKYHLYRVLPFENFGYAWLALREDHCFDLLNDDQQDAKNVEFVFVENTTNIINFMLSGERLELTLISVDYEELVNYVKIIRLLGD